MKLQRQPGSTYTNKAGKTTSYDKWVVVIPPDVVEALGWKDGLEISPATRGRTLTLRPADSTD